MTEGGNMPESDSLGDQHRAIDGAIAKRRRSRLVRTTRRSQAEVRESTEEDQPAIPPTSILGKPWNKNMVRPINSSGRYRDINPVTGAIIKGHK